MIRAIVETTEGPALILGLNGNETHELLHNECLVRLKLGDLDPSLPELSLLLIAGESDEAVERELRSYGAGDLYIRILPTFVSRASVFGPFARFARRWKQRGQ